MRRHSRRNRRRASAAAVFGLMIVGFVIEGFVLSAILVHMVPMLDALSLSTTAIFVTTLFGPAQMLSRFTNLIFGRTLRQTNLAVIAAGLLAAGLIALLLTLPWLAGAMLFAVLFGFGSGITSIIGGTLPLELFGRAGYGARVGWISSARLFASAVAPYVFSVLQEGYGVQAALWVLAGFGCLGIAAFVAMAAMAGAGRTAIATTGTRELRLRSACQQASSAAKQASSWSPVMMPKVSSPHAPSSMEQRSPAAGAAPQFGGLRSLHVAGAGQKYLASAAATSVRSRCASPSG